MFGGYKKLSYLCRVIMIREQELKRITMLPKKHISTYKGYLEKKIVFAILFVLVAATADAQFLFRVSGNGLSAPSYLLGTIHYLPGSLLDNSAEYLEAEAQCQQMYVEHKITYKRKAAAQQKQEQPTVTYQDGKNIFDLIDAQSATILKEKLKEVMNIDLDDPTWKDYLNWTPAVYYNLLVSRLRSQTRPHGPMMDGVLMMKAQKQGWDVGELDDEELTLESLNEHQNELPPTIDIQADSLMALLKGYEQKRQILTEGYEKLTKYWILGDYEGFASTQLTSVHQHTAIFEKRNAKWLPRMQVAMSEKPTMLVFGAGHLIGEQGVIQLLRTAGYEVEQIKIKQLSR